MAKVFKKKCVRHSKVVLVQKVAWKRLKQSGEAVVCQEELLKAGYAFVP